LRKICRYLFAVFVNSGFYMAYRGTMTVRMYPSVCWHQVCMYKEEPKNSGIWIFCANNM